MDRENFALKNGFRNYKEMLTNSFTVVYDHGISFFATHIPNRGWLAWIDKRPEQVIGLFETLEKAHEQLFYIFAQQEFEQLKTNGDYLC